MQVGKITAPPRPVTARPTKSQGSDGASAVLKVPIEMIIVPTRSKRRRETRSIHWATSNAVKPDMSE